MTVEVANNNFWLVSQLKFAFNGTIQTSKGKLFKWRLKANQATAFLELILPYLHLKKAQAELAIRFQARKRPGIRLSDEERALQEADSILCKNLKRR